jgi:adenylosuccinate synthase
VGESVESAAHEKVRQLCKHYNPLLAAMGLSESPESDNIAVLDEAAELFRRFVSYEQVPFSEISKSQKCVLEGAQGVLLDLDHGTYPYVTSSNTIPAFAAVGTPFPMSRLGQVLGIAKAYLTRVGLGPFESELNDETGERIRQKGHEFGATTGRPRRVGWLNLDELRLAVQLSDCTGIALTKADVLMGEARVFALVNKQLTAFEGWNSMVQDSKLNANLETFIQAIESHVGVPVVAVGTGQDREDIYWRHTIEDFWMR